MNDHDYLSTEQLTFGLSILVSQRKKFLFRTLTEGESRDLKRLNHEIKIYKQSIHKRQLRLEGF